MWKKLLNPFSKMQTYWFVLAVYCFAHVFCSQIKSAAAESHSHHHRQQQQHHLNPAGNSEGNTAGTTAKEDHSSTFKSKLPWHAPEQGIEKHNKDVEQGFCRYKRCGAGRKCIVSPSTGQAKCSCIKNCKKEGKSNKPVCGTDGRLYSSYCDLRRTACLTGAHIFFSHYQHQQQEKHHHHHQQHHDEVYHHQDGSYQQHRQRDISFGIGSGSRNGSTTLSQQHNNIIPSRRDFGANQDPQCFPFIQPHHHSYQYNHHRYQHHHSHYHNDPDKNPLRDKNLGSIQPQSPLQPSTTLQHSKFSRNDEIHSAEYQLDDDDGDGDDEQDEHNYQNSRSVSSIDTTRTATTAASLTLGENGDDLRDEAENYAQNVYDENHDDDYDSDADDDENGGINPDSKKIGSGRVGRTALQRQHHHHHSHHQDFTVDYPDGITGQQKKRKISSRPTNARVDSRHISERDHSDILAASSYYDFMELNKDGKPKEEKGMKGKASDLKRQGGKTEFSWGKDDDGDEDEEVDDEMSSQALFLGDGVKSSETLEPTAATNLEWKLLQAEEINRGRSKDGSSNGHWDDPVKKSSSFVRAGHKTDDEDGKVYGNSEGSFSKREDSAVGSFRSTISHNSARVGSSTPASPRHNVCSPQDYEILKAELFQYDMSKLMNHIKLMTSVSNDAVADDDNDNTGSVKRRADADDIGRYPREARSSGDAPWSDVRMMTATTSSPPPPWLNMEGDGPEADKDNLLRGIVELLDRNHDSVLEYIELYKADMESPLELYSPEKTGCQFRDFLLFDDTDQDGQLHVNEFFSSFSHFYDITMISLEKSLEIKRTLAVKGENVLLRCDITGSPPPRIQWQRCGKDTRLLENPSIRSNTEDTLTLTNINVILGGQYSCNSPRNPEVVQTHEVEVISQPEVVLIPKASFKRVGEDHLFICTEITGLTGSVSWTWLFNGVPLRELPKSDNNNNNKYIFDSTNSSSRLRIREIYFQDMGSYSCQAENAAGSASASSSLVVVNPDSKPEVQALHNANAKQLLVFHRNGLASYSAENCGWLWEIFGDDVLHPSAKEGKDVARAVCNQFHSLCNWGNAVQVSPNLVYVSQPSQGRVLLIDVGAVQSVGNAIGIIQTCANINNIEYVSYTDQLWIRCEVDHDKRQTVLFNVVENASKGDHHKAIQFPFHRRDAPGGEGPVRITEIYLPSHQDGRRGKKDCQFAFVSFSDEQSLQRIDLKTFTYHKNGYLNLTKFSCIPHQIHFSLSCSMSIINCLDPKSKTPNGQLVVDTLSNSVRYKTAEISGISIVSSDNRILLTEKHVENNTHLFVQRIGVYEINLLSHFLLSNHYTNIRVVHSMLTGAYASVAKLPTGKEAVISLQTGETQSVDDLLNMVPHISRATALYSADSAFPLKTDKSVIVMDAETLRPRCKFYEEIPELQSFLTVHS